MVKIKDLRKNYGKFQALDGMNLEIKKGELFGFVGPNGAGKTTTMRIMSGLLSADAGLVMVGDVNVTAHPNKVKDKIGYMPDFFGVYDNLKAIEYMEFFASIYGFYGKSARKLCLEMMDLVNLSDKQNAYVDGLSRGMKQRLCLARCLIHSPELLILDEPASGLDPRARFEMKEILRNLSDMGKTILISSHILPELAEMCTNVGIVEHGKLIVSGTVDDIMSKMNSSNPLVVKFEEGQEETIHFLKENPSIENISIRSDKVYIGFQGNSMDEGRLLSEMIGHGAVISSYGREEGNLESLFMQITGNEEE